MRIPVDGLQAFSTDLFIAAGCGQEEAQRISRHLIASDLAGHPSHGVVRVRRYIDSLAAGVVIPGRTVEVVEENDSLLVLDGGFGFGQTVGEQAVRLGVAKAERSGVAVVALRHAGHLGRIADWAEQAVEAGYLSIHLVNVTSTGLVAPFGGRERRLGTNPIAIGIPQQDRPPILIDFATSVVAEGKAKVAMNGGPPVPDNALVDGEGRITGDTTALYGEVPPGESPDPRRGSGALRAMGDQKGSALALACELLAGVLTGSGTSGSQPFCNGMLSIYLSHEHFAVPGFAAQATQFADYVRSSASAADAEAVLLPGDPERAKAEEQRANGIDLAAGTWDDLVLTAEKLGVAVPAL